MADALVDRDGMGDDRRDRYVIRLPHSLQLMTAGGSGRPRRRASDDHWHDGLWTDQDQHRFEDRIAAEISGIRGELKSLGNRVTLLLGGMALLAFLIPLVAPFIRQALNFPNP